MIIQRLEIVSGCYGEILEVYKEDEFVWITIKEDGYICSTEMDMSSAKQLRDNLTKILEEHESSDS